MKKIWLCLVGLGVLLLLVDSLAFAGPYVGLKPGTIPNKGINLNKQTGRPNPGGTMRRGAPLLALQIDRIEDARRRRVGQVMPGDSVRVCFTLSNQGAAATAVRIRGAGITGPVTMIGANKQDRFCQAVTVDRNIPWNGSWDPVFVLIDADSRSSNRNQVFRDSTPRDNTAKVNGVGINLAGDLAVAGIKNVQLKMITEGGPVSLAWLNPNWKGAGFDKPTAVALDVVINNNTNETSARRRLTVKLSGLSEYVSWNVKRNQKHYKVGNSHVVGCTNRTCSQQVSVDIPSIRPFGGTNVRVVIPRPGYTLWVYDRAGKGGARPGYHAVRAGGYYMCSTTTHDQTGSRMKVFAELDGRGDSRPNNNGMSRAVTFGPRRGNACGATEMSAIQSYRPR